MTSTSSTDTTVTIERRFRGPDDSGNGGYTCGLAARLVDGPAEVTLRQPPLGRPVTVDRIDDGTVALLDGDALVAQARPSAGSLEPPPPVSLEIATRAETSPEELGAHPFPSCFVCGPLRSDGLRIFPGEVGNGLLAAPWTPGADLADAEGAWRRSSCGLPPSTTSKGPNSRNCTERSLPLRRNRVGSHPVKHSASQECWGVACQNNPELEEMTVRQSMKGMTALVAGALLTLAACQPAATEPTTTAAEQPAEAQAADGVELEAGEAGATDAVEPVDMAAQELRFTFAEEVAEDSCAYEGPATVPAGVQPFAFDNRHPERTLEVIITRINEGFDYEDALEWLGDVPHEVAERVLTPDWLDGDWRPIKPVDPATAETVDVPTTPGNYALFCFLQDTNPRHGHAWPATALVVTE